MESGLVDEIGVHLKPLISAAATDSRGKEACRTYGPFLLQASQLVGHALGKKGLGTQAQADWLAAARHLLGGLMVIAPHTQCKHPLQLEKLAMGLIQKHLDARLYAEVQPHVDALVTRLAVAHGRPSDEDYRTQRKALKQFPAHREHASGGCTRCCELAPGPASDAGMCTLALASLQARMACVIGQGDIQFDALVCCSCANLVWVEHADTVEVQLARRSRGRLVHMLHEAADQQIRRGDHTTMPFQSYVTAIDVIMLAGARPENVGMRTCVDHMIKADELAARSGAADRIRVSVLDGYKQVIGCVTSSDAARNSWAVVECLRLVERYATLCGKQYPHNPEQVWKTFISWCQPRGTKLPVNMLVHAAGALHLSISKLKQKSSEAADWLHKSADLVQYAHEVCFENVQGQCEQSDEQPLEYNAMLRMVIRGGVLVRLKDLALEYVQSSPARASETLLAIEAVMVRLVDILCKACQWEQKTKLPVKFGSSQLVRFRLGVLHAASVARLEHGLLASTGVSSQEIRKTKKQRSTEDALQRESMEAALLHLRSAGVAVQAVGPGNAELMRYVASFSYNAAIRLSSCERNEEAIQALTLSCEQLQACCSSNEDINQALCARWTLFAKCKDKMQDTGGIVESLKDVVMQVGASLSTDPCADRNFFAPLVFQHASAHLKSFTSNQVANPKGNGKASAKTKAKSKRKSNNSNTGEETQGRMLLQFLWNAGEHINRSRFGILLEEYLAQVGSAGNRLKMSTEDLQLAIIDKLLLVYGENDESLPHQLGRARALLHKARFARAAGQLADLESASKTAAQAITLLQSLRDSVKDCVAERRHVLEHVATIHTFHATFCMEQHVMRSTTAGLDTTAEESFVLATKAFSDLILGGEDSFCDIEEVCSGLQMLSDYYRLMGNQAMELHLLRLRLRLVSSSTLATSQGNSQCESCAHLSDRVTVLAEASMLHTRLGFSEQGVVLADEALKESTKMTPCVHLERANALAHFAKALGHCRSAVHSLCVPSVQELLDKHSAQRGRSWSAVDACGRYVLAEALWVKGDCVHAAQVAMDALQVRVSLAPGCQELMANDGNAEPAKARAAQSIHDGEDAQGLDLQVSNPQIASTRSAGATSTWGVLYNLLESLLQAGLYACHSGRGVEGESYLQKALNISERLVANSWKARIQCVLAEVHYLRHDDRYKLEVQPAISLCSQHTLEYICALSILVDCCRKSDDWGSAISKCEEGLRNLEVMRHPKFLKDHVYKVSIDNTSYCVVDDIAICGQQPSKLVLGNDAEAQPCLFPYQLEQAHAKLELKQGQVCCSSGDNTEATKLFKRALTRTDKDQPLQAIVLYRLGCQHISQCSAQEETIVHKWSLHSATQDTVKSTTRKSRGRRGLEDGACSSKQFRAAQDCFEQALSIAIAHDMAGLASKLCHRLAAMHGRQAQASCRLLQASLCVPLSSRMQSLLVSQAAQHDIPDLQTVTGRFCVNTLVSASAEHFQEQYIDKLAPDWIVCSCTVDYTDDGQAALFVSRMVSHRAPTVVRIPMGGDSDGELNLLRTVTADWESLIQRNIDSLQGGAKTTTTKKLSTEEKTAWWDRRSELDDDMKTCLQRLEQSWLGGFKGLLLGQPVWLDESDVKACAIELKRTVFATCGVEPSLIELVLSSADVLDENELQQACTDMLVGQVGSFLQDQQTSICKLAKTAAHKIRLAFDDMSNGTGRQRARGPTILLLGQEVQQLPWESLPCFRSCGQSVTRMPALPFVLARHMHLGGPNWLWHVDPGVHPNRTFYVLNPAGDLVATQETFEEAFSNRNEWEGFTGTAPSCDAYKNGLHTKDLFIYCGHSTGERYLRGSELAQLDRCAVTLLMGCSSGKLRKAGSFGVEGMPLSYVLAGCPALVANLWDVTDKDIDKFSSTLLEAWVDGKGSQASAAGERKARSLPEELPQARKACKLLYLNGAAPVCYGVPCVPVAATT